MSAGSTIVSRHEFKSKFYRECGNSTTSEVFGLHVQDLSLSPQTHLNNRAWWQVCNPSSGEAETSSRLMLISQSAQPNGVARGQ